MASASRFRIKSQAKSISLPSRPHPVTYEIEELLNKIKTIVAEGSSAEAVCRGLLQLTTLYKCMDDMLTLSTTHVLMSGEQNKKWVDQLVDESVKFLDICGSTRDVLSEIKNHIRDLRCALRRRKGDTNVENNITKYTCYRKKMKKDVKVLLGNLKQVDHIITNCGGLLVVDSDNHQLAAVIKAIIGVSEMTVSVFEFLLVFLSVPVSKQNKWSLVMSKLRHKGMVACEDHQEQRVVNEFERIDDVLRKSLSDVENMRIAHCGLERLENHIERIESGLDCMFRCLVRTRVSLLNITSH